MVELPEERPLPELVDGRRWDVHNASGDGGAVKDRNEEGVPLGQLMAPQVPGKGLEKWARRKAMLEAAHTPEITFSAMKNQRGGGAFVQALEHQRIIGLSEEKDISLLDHEDETLKERMEVQTQAIQHSNKLDKVAAQRLRNLPYDDSGTSHEALHQSLDRFFGEEAAEGLIEEINGELDDTARKVRRNPYDDELVRSEADRLFSIFRKLKEQVQEQKQRWNQEEIDKQGAMEAFQRSKEEERRAKAKDTESKRAEWADVKVVEEDLKAPRSTSLRRRETVPAHTGKTPRYWNRWVGDKKVFAREKSKKSQDPVTILVDLSGSMYLSVAQIETLMEKARECTIYGYAGVDDKPDFAWREDIDDLYGYGFIQLLARNDRRIPSERIMTKNAGGTYNWCDGEALNHIADRPGKKLWVSDGKINGVPGHVKDEDGRCLNQVSSSGPHLEKDVDRIMEGHDIERVPTVSECIEKLEEMGYTGRG